MDLSKHNCLFEAEVSEFKHEHMKAIPRPRRLDGERLSSLFRKVAGALAVVTLLTALGALSGLPLVDWPLVGVFAVMAFAAFILMVREESRDQDWDRESRLIDIELREASPQQKEWILEQYEKHYEVSRTVTSWIAQGKTIRVRDYCAIRLKVEAAEQRMHAHRVEQALRA
ncbi:hypothetical protein RKE25_22205 (plasmid) [Dyella sp. BiH032]|uniref:hypothetical protein n=1 Tax=Dyella sp. BiH032 TaxID=3075430 RepID=UPI002892FE14|nr:hypothetical protein [Dyella sp. BiH032]WNL48445.1 hypothetical protein RKE25_22205 [Dyella sp. BiH032]